MALAGGGTPGARPKRKKGKQRQDRYCCVCHENIHHNHYKVLAPSENTNSTASISYQAYASLQETLNKALDITDIVAQTDSNTSFVCEKCRRTAEKIVKSSTLKRVFKATFLETQKKRSVTGLVNFGNETPTKDDGRGREKRMSKGTPEGTPTHRPKKRPALFPTPTKSTDLRSETSAEQDSSCKPLSEVSAVDGCRVQITITYPTGSHMHEIKGVWAETLERLCYGGEAAAVKHLLTLPNVKAESTTMVANDIKRECIGLCSTSNSSLFGSASAESLAKWSPAAHAQELNARAPTFLTFLEAAGTPSGVARNKKKTTDVVRNGLMAAAGVILKTRNKNMNAYQTIVSLALKQGGAGEKTFRRLHALGMCDSHQALADKLDQFCVGYDAVLKNWQEDMLQDDVKEKDMLLKLASVEGEIVDGGDLLLLKPYHRQLQKELDDFNSSRHPGYQLVGDNVDMRVRVRQMTTTNQDQDIHHFNHLAIKNRVNAHHLPDDLPLCPPSQFQPNLILPNTQTNANLRSNWIVQIGHIIAEYLPQLSWIKDFLPENIPHKHMAEARQKSETVALGVLPFDENTKPGIREIMKNMHTRVPGHDTISPVKIISAGDLLTCSRESGAQENVRASEVPGGNLEGLIPVIADFHLLGNFYQGFWKAGFDRRSVGEPGTMYHAKTLLMAKNVPDNPMKNVNASKEFLDKYTEALVTSAAVEYFGMKDMDAEPSTNVYQEGDRSKYVHQKLGELVDTFAIPDNAIHEGESMHLCPLCSKEYVTVSGVREHMQKDHGPDKNTADNQASNEDGIYNYCCNMLSLCLLCHNFTNARQLADGERLLHISRYMMIFFKLTGKRNYAFHTFRLLLQTNVLLTPRQSYNLVHNRFVNTHSQSLSSNIEPDRLNEHFNRDYKDNYRGLNGKATTAAINRVSRSARNVTSALTAFDRENNVKPRSRKRVSQDHKEDVRLLVNRMNGERIFAFQPNRYHKTYPGMKKNFMSMVDHAALNQWIRSAFNLEIRKGIWSHLN